MYRKITYEQYKEEFIAFFRKINQRFRDENIFWWAHSGTLLGAVRNKKFIPWDDDIDMAMTSHEFYSKLEKINIISQEMNFMIADKLKFNGLNSSRLISKEKVIIVYKGKEYLSSFFIDIMIGVPVKRESKMRSFYWYISNRYMILFSKFWKPLPNYRLINGNPKKIFLLNHVLIFLVRFLVLPLYFYKYIERYTINKASKNISKDKIELHYGWSHIRIYYDLNQIEELEIEGILINVVSNWDFELKKRYGNNYLKPPEMNHRTPKHFILMPISGKRQEPFPFIIM